MADYMHFSLRLNRELPEHYKIIKFLDEMDPKNISRRPNFWRMLFTFTSNV